MVDLSDLNIPTAKECREMSEKDEAFKACIKRNIESIKKAIERHEDHSVLWLSGYSESKKEFIHFGKDVILNALRPYGYREYTRPVYIGGVLQLTDFITWY